MPEQKFLTNLDVAGTVDLSNLTIDSAQGTDGQVLTSTGSGIAWEDASGGASLSGGAANKLAIWSGTDTLTNDTNLHWDTSNDRLGIGTPTPGSMLHLKSAGDVKLILEADSDNSGENDNPLIELKQDGGGIISRFGNVGDAGQIFTNSRSNSTGLGSVYQQDLILFTENSARVYIKGENGYQGRVGIGRALPSQTLDVNGNVTANRYYGNTNTNFYIDPNDGTTAAKLAGGLEIGYGGNGEYRIEVGEGRTGDGYAYIDFVGDTTYSDYGLRLIRNNSGANTSSQLVHRGTGNLEFKTWDAGDMIFSTANTERMQIASGGYVQATNSFRAPIFYDSANSNFHWNPNTDNSHRFTTPSGYLDIGPKNTSWCHLYTDRNGFYFNKTTFRLNGNQVFHDGYHPNADTWTTGRTITIGDTGKTVDGSADVSWSLSEIGAAASSHTHAAGDITSGTFSAARIAHNSFDIGDTTAETGRSVHETGIYTFNRNNGNLGTGTNTSYYSVLAYGQGAGGSAQIATEWTNGGNKLYFRSLRDTVDNWWSWKEIYHTGHVPTYSELGTMAYSNLTGTPSSLPANGGNADTVDNYHANNFFRRIHKATATVGPGWMTVAENVSGRKAGEIIVTDADSGDHAYIRIEWMRSYADSNFTVLNCGGHQNRITGARVLSNTSDPTYGGKKLQVYVTTSSNYEVNIYEQGDIDDYATHSVVTPVIQNTISGYALHGNQLENLDTYGFAAEEGILSGGDLKVLGGVNGIHVDSAGHASLRLDRGSTSYDNNVLFMTGGGIKWRLWQDGTDDQLMIRDNVNSYNSVIFNAGGSSGYTTFVNSARAPIFYDENNTGYYVDPASTSRFNDINNGSSNGAISYGYDVSSIPNTIGCSNWFRSSGATGWYNGSYSGGIYMSDSTWVRIYGTKKFYVDNTNYDAVYTAGGVRALTQMRAPIYYDGNNTSYYGHFDSTGDSIRAAGDIVAYYSSDKRYKENIKLIESPIEKVKAISGVTFEWNEKSHKETGKKDVGVIAQEVEEVLPEIVETRDNGYKAVDYQKLTAVLIEAVKDQQKQIDELKSIINGSS